MVNNEQIRALVREIEPELVEIRHQLHQHPELSNQEFHTAGLIAATPRPTRFSRCTSIPTRRSERCMSSRAR